MKDLLNELVAMTKPEKGYCFMRPVSGDIKKEFQREKYQYIPILDSEQAKEVVYIVFLKGRTLKTRNYKDFKLKMAELGDKFCEGEYQLVPPKNKHAVYTLLSWFMEQQLHKPITAYKLKERPASYSSAVSRWMSMELFSYRHISRVQ